MSYVMRVRKSDGTVETTRHGESLAPVCERGYGRVIVHDENTVRRVALGRLKDRLDARTADIREGMNAVRAQNRSSRGMTRGKTMKQTAIIPREIWAMETIRNGPGCMRDPLHQQRVIAEHGLRVS